VLAIHSQLAGLERDYRYRPPRTLVSGEIESSRQP